MIDPISLFGGAISTGLNLFGQDKATKENAKQAQKQMDFQERMSSTSYQRSMADMRAAGLNPILAYSKGGASSPSGASGSAVYQSVSDAVTPAVSTALQSSRLQADLANLKETNAVLRAQQTQIGSQTANINADTLTKLEGLKVIAAQASKASNEKNISDSWVGKIIDSIGYGARQLNPLGPLTGGR